MSELDQSPLLSLAPELIQVITDELPTDTIKNLRLTCKPLGEILNPRLFRDLSISFSQTTLENDLSKVRILATTDCHAASFGTRTLKIASLSPGYDQNYQGPLWKCVEGEWVQGPYPEDPSEVVAAEEELKGYLFKAIASLKGIQSVEWNPVQKDSDWAQEAVMKALKTLPNLRVLLLDITHCKIPLTLHDLSGIQDISVCGVRYHAEILDNIAKLVAWSPEITSIEMLSDWRYRQPVDKSQSLHQIFKYYPQSSPPLQLRRLSLKNSLVKLDDVTLPHLQNLTSLSLVNIDDPYNKRSRWGTPESSNLQHVEEQKKYGSSLDDIWETLKLSRIHLKELTLDVVVPSFLEYLASYSGLKKLQLTAGGFLGGSTSDSTAKQFFSTPLTNHIQSLEDLGINALFEGSWCFGPCNLAVISRCTNLKNLRMAVISGQIHLSQGNLDKFEDIGDKPNVVKFFIDTVSHFMPRLESLAISAANLEGLRWALCGNPSMEHFRQTARDIITSVHKYKAPPTCHRLPHLTVKVDHGRNFIPGGPGEDGRLCYIDTNPPTHDDHYLWW